MSRAIVIFQIFLLSLALPAFAQQGAEEGTTKNEELAPAAQIDGSDKDLGRFDFGDRGFSMIPPMGWTVRPVVQAQPIEIVSPDDKKTSYRGNIKIMRFNKPISLTDSTKEQIAELITKKHSYLSYIEGYRVRKGNESELNDGTQAVLYYSDFEINDLSMMQAHVIIPGKDHHFIATYTDLAQNFDGEKSEIFLETVWPALASIKVADPAPVESKWQHFLPTAVGLTLLVLLSIFIFKFLKKRTEERELNMNMEDEKKVSMNSSQEELDHIIGQKMQTYTDAVEYGDNVDSKHAEAEFEGFDEDEDSLAV